MLTSPVGVNRMREGNVRTGVGGKGGARCVFHNAGARIRIVRKTLPAVIEGLRGKGGEPIAGVE